NLCRGLHEIHYIDNCSRWVNNVKVNDGRYLDCDIISCNNLLWWDCQCNNTQIDFDHTRDNWWHPEHSRSFRTCKIAQNKNDSTLILLYNTNARKQKENDDQN